MVDKITQSRLKELLAYDAETGVFTWRVDRRGYVRAGMVAGGVDSDGHIKLKLDGKHYKAHRLAWLYVYGFMPSTQIDHINGIRNDNRIENLREATSRENARNRKPKSNTGLKGVSFSGRSLARPFVASICVDGKRIKLGYFLTAEEAHKEYCQAATRYFGEFARTA